MAAMNSALSRTSVSSTVILSSTSSLFTLILGRMIGTERIDLAKLAAVGCSIVGVALVTNADRQVDPMAVEAPRRVVGDALALLSAMLYAVYVSLLKSRAGDESRLNLALFFGFVRALCHDTSDAAGRAVEHPLPLADRSSAQRAWCRDARDAAERSHRPGSRGQCRDHIVRSGA